MKPKQLKVQCRECKFFEKGSDGLLFCRRPHPLTGERYVISKWCQSERQGGKFIAKIFNKCGREGRFFEPNDEV